MHVRYRITEIWETERGIILCKMNLDILEFGMNPSLLGLNLLNFYLCKINACYAPLDIWDLHPISYSHFYFYFILFILCNQS